MLSKNYIQYLVYQMNPQNHQALISKDQFSHPQNNESHVKTGQYLKSSIYGGLDGVVNTLTVILGGIASGTSPAHILAVGVSVLIGDGLGMGLGDYLSAKSEKQFIKNQQKRQLWEVKYKLKAQKAQITQIYVQKGYTKQQSNRLADLFSTNDQAFVNVMMLEQLGLVVKNSSPVFGGTITFFAFAIFGFFPLLPYIIGEGILNDKSSQYTLVAIVIGSIQLFGLGFAKAIIIGLNKITSGLETLVLGALAVGIGYLVGLALNTNNN